MSERCRLVRITRTHIGFHASSFDTWNPGCLRGKLLPWPCNMWYLVPKRRRNRSGHRQTPQVARVPIIFSRLPAALSPRSLDVSERQNPGFFMEDWVCLPSVALFFPLTHSVLPAKWRGRGVIKKKRRKSSGLGHRRFPDDADIRAPGVHRGHCRSHFSLKSTGNVREIGVSSCGRGVLLTCPYGESTRWLRSAPVRFCAPQLLIIGGIDPSWN